MDDTTPWSDNATQIRKFMSNVSIIADCIGWRKTIASRQRDDCGCNQITCKALRHTLQDREFDK